MSAIKALTFGPWRLIPERRLLLLDGEPAPIGARAFDLLNALVERAGELIGKEQLLDIAWPKTSVHEANLRVHIGGLRKLLGDGRAGMRYIASEARRGYRFVAPVAVSEEPTEPNSERSTPDRSFETETVQADFMPIIGRSKVVETIAQQLPIRRFITIVGAGGIGKTTVARAVAARASRACETTFVDLSPLSDSTLVCSKLAASLGLASRLDDPMPELVGYLRDKRMLIVVDTCEHVIDAATPLIEGILDGAPQVQILATSREPLRCRGERIHRLAPLALPDPSETLGAAEALTFPGVQLFVECAGASLGGFELRDADAPIVASICHKLDGMPLAIELAASRIDAFGLRGLSQLIERRFQLPTLGRRMSPPRHRTIAATLDWSYLTLPEPERVILRRLAIFAGPFTLDSASFVAADGAMNASGVVDCVANLVEKSLVTADLGGAEAHYRLLDMTRAYAFDKLREHEEAEPLARRHAEYYRNLFERTRSHREKRAAEWAASLRHAIDDVRSALDWAFSLSGDAALGLALTLAAIPLWTHLSMNEECCSRVEAALSRLDAHDPSQARCRMQLSTALGVAMIYARGVAPEIAAWSDMLACAEQLQDQDFQLRALLGWWAEHFSRCEHRAALALARRFAERAHMSQVASDAFVGQRMIGLSLHFLGEQEEARRLTEHMLEHYAPDPTDITRFQLDQRLLARAFLAVILWLQGFPDQARRLSSANVDGIENSHGITFNYMLAQSACPLAFLTGDLSAADRCLAMFSNRRTQHGAVTWGSWAKCYEAIQLVERGDRRGLQSLSAELQSRPTTSMRLQYGPLLCRLADAQRADGQTAEALATIEKAVRLALRDDELWHLPELLRVKGEIEAARGASDAAETCFLDSLDLARRQTALSWELRSAISFARLRQTQGRAKEALEILAPVYGRFTEGFDTKDLKAAARQLEELGGAP